MSIARLMMQSAATRGIKYVGGYAVGVAATTNSITVTFGGNLTGGSNITAYEGDLVIVYFGTGSSDNRSLTQPTGYTEIVELYSNNNRDANLSVSYKFMGVTPDTSFVLPNGTAFGQDGGAVAVHVFRNVDPTNPFDVSETTATGINTMRCDPPAITPSTLGSYIVSGGVGATIFNIGTTSCSFGSSDLDGFVTSSQNATYDAVIGAGYKKWDGGSFDPAQFSLGCSDDTSNSWAGVTLALKPA